MADPTLEAIREMVADGKSNLKIALSLGMNIKDVILAVKGMAVADGRDDLRNQIKYVPTVKPEGTNRKYTPWTTGECEAVLTPETTAASIARQLGRTPASVHSRRAIMKRQALQREESVLR